MKILYISPRYAGGTGGNAATVSKKLRERGFDVKQMQVPHLPIKNLKNPSFALFAVLKAIFDRNSYDVAHAWNVPSAFAMRFARARKKVLTIYGVYSEQVAALHSGSVASIVGAAETKVLGWADKLATDSVAVQKAYAERLGFQFVLLPGPLDTSKFQDVPDLPKTKDQVAYIGRDSYEKGIDILRNIEPRIRGKVVYCTNVSWHQAMSVLKSSEVLVLPSRIESLPLVIREAFYLKVPVVATNVGGVPELIVNGVTGTLVPPNDPDKLVEAVNYLLENKDQASKMAENAYQYVVKNWTCEAIIPRYIEFYERLVVT
jgi:glycosyltransferase involved in cell wall biosynthesis